MFKLKIIRIERVKVYLIRNIHAMQVGSVEGKPFYCVVLSNNDALLQRFVNEPLRSTAAEQKRITHVTPANVP